MSQGAPLSLKTIMRIRADYARGISQVALAGLYDLHRTTISRAVVGNYSGVGLGNISRGRGRPRKK